MKLLHISLYAESIWDLFSDIIGLFNIKSFVLLLFIWVKDISDSLSLFDIILFDVLFKGNLDEFSLDFNELL